MNRILVPVFSLASLVAPTIGLATEPVTYYDDIRPVMEDKCLACHSEKSVSFSFEDAESSYPFAPAITSAVLDRRMPPWLAEPGHQDYVGDYSLKDEELELFRQWAANDHAKGEARQYISSESIAGAFEPDLTLDVQPGFEYLPNQKRKDDYRCFLVDWPYEETRYVTGFNAEPGNLRVAHHLVLFAVPPESADFIRTLSEDEPGYGHQCFGGVLPDKVADNKQARETVEQNHPGEWQKLNDSSYWLSHWAPGVTGFEFPQDSGILVEPGSVLVIQMHYYSAYAPGETDGNTKMSFQVADTVRKPSINYPMTNGDWLNAGDNGSMVIPAGESRTYETSSSFESIKRRASEVLKVSADEIESIELRSANLHMHAYGSSGRISLQHPSGMKETLLNVPTWDLDWQRDFEFTRAKTVLPDDFRRTRLEVECTFENYSEGPVVGGYGSYDEMCFNFSYVSLVKKSEGSGPGTTSTAPPN